LPMNLTKAFFAYASQPNGIGATIEAACKLASEEKSSSRIQTWPQMSVFGDGIADQVRSSIDGCSIFFFDITTSNQNVYYEAGYAIGAGKVICPVVNISFSDAVQSVVKDGIFDDIGYRSYQNKEELLEILKTPSEAILSELYSQDISKEQPIFVLDTVSKTDFRNSIVSAVKASKLHYRSFDPIETPRFSVTKIIKEVSRSTGVVVPFLPSNIRDADRHNLRAAFLLGLTHGMARESAAIQDVTASAKVPMDFQNLVRFIRDEAGIEEEISLFSTRAKNAAQSARKNGQKSSRSALQMLTLGASAAENEFRTLSRYFVETAEFFKTLRGEVNVVAGRKGSGKTAIFFQVRDTLREKKQYLIVDLKPESHQLSLFRETLLKTADVGTFDHSLAAFWYFLLLSELFLAAKQDFERRAKNSNRLLLKLKDLSSTIERYGIGEPGDFTMRLNRLGAHITREVETLKKRNVAISSELLTNIVFKGGVSDLKKAAGSFLEEFKGVTILFDNIDKGWPTNGVDIFDIRLVRLLVETLNKMKRDLSSETVAFASTIFLRNDIYELMVGETPDRGKAGQVRIDWTDRAKLRQVVLRRLQSSTQDKESPFETLWSRFFEPTVSNQHSFEYLLDHCLMRPRFLIDIIENAVSHAINRGNDIVDEDAMTDAVRQHSLALIDDFGFEIQDVSGLSAELLYSLVGTEKMMLKSEYIALLQVANFTKEEAEKAFDLMIWYGVVGIIDRNSDEKYIYDYEYNKKRLDAEAKLLSGDLFYVTNSALHVAMR
jgi:hypothetical protein